VPAAQQSPRQQLAGALLLLLMSVPLQLQKSPQLPLLPLLLVLMLGQQKQQLLQVKHCHYQHRMLLSQQYPTPD
jgi:hypothetical protein